MNYEAKTNRGRQGFSSTNARRYAKKSKSKAERITIKSELKTFLKTGIEPLSFKSPKKG
jgi:hypothetical protein